VQLETRSKYWKWIQDQSFGTGV